MRFRFPFLKKKEEELTFPLDYERCHNCGSRETVAKKISSKETNLPEGTFFSLEQVATSLQDPRTVTLPTLRVILSHYDVCKKCGTRRCTRVEIKQLPVASQLQNPTFKPGNQRRS
jgi:hypothetical protein